MSTRRHVIVSPATPLSPLSTRLTDLSQPRWAEGEEWGTIIICLSLGARYKTDLPQPGHQHHHVSSSSQVRQSPQSMPPPSVVSKLWNSLKSKIIAERYSVNLTQTLTTQNAGSTVPPSSLPDSDYINDIVDSDNNIIDDSDNDLIDDWLRKQSADQTNLTPDNAAWLNSHSLSGLISPGISNAQYNAKTCLAQSNQFPAFLTRWCWPVAGVSRVGLVLECESECWDTLSTWSSAVESARTRDTASWSSLVCWDWKCAPNIRNSSPRTTSDWVSVIKMMIVSTVSRNSVRRRIKWYVSTPTPVIHIVQPCTLMNRKQAAKNSGLRGKVRLMMRCLIWNK